MWILAAAIVLGTGSGGHPAAPSPTFPPLRPPALAVGEDGHRSPSPPSPAIPDTLRLNWEDAIARALSLSAPLRAARERDAAAEHRLDQSRAFVNPTLEMAAENVGAEEETTGHPRWRGLEGQLVLGTTLRVGGDRRAAIEGATAERDRARAERALLERDLHAGLLLAVTEVERERGAAANAAAERDALEGFAAALRQGAEMGRFPEGDAARARIAAVRAGTETARRAAAALEAESRLAHRLGVAPGTVVEVALPSRCPALPDPGMEGEGLPERAIAEARSAAARAEIARSRAARIPDLSPQVGFRRMGGENALFLGMAIDLPLFDRGGGAVAAGRAELSAAEAEVEGLDRAFAAELQAAVGRVRLFEEAGAHFDDAWWRALERSVIAAEAHYELGEGTLVELLDARRARLAALDDFGVWRSELSSARIRAARLSGIPLDAGLLCSVVTGEGR